MRESRIIWSRLVKVARQVLNVLRRSLHMIVTSLKSFVRNIIIIRI